MAPPSRSGSRPGRALAALAVLILVMLISITGSQTFSPGNWRHQFKVGLGLDLSSGTKVTLLAQIPNGGAPSSAEMQTAISVLENRVNGTGNTGAQVQEVNNNTVAVTVPGKGANDVINLIGSSAKLAFRPVLLEQTYSSPSASASATPSASASGSASASAKASATPSTSASKSATAKASAQDYSAKVATASATPTTSTSATATSSSTAKASASATASATPTSPSTATTSTAYGDPSKVNAATMKLFNKLKCTPSSNANTVDPSWKATVGYTEAGDQWDNPNNQIVSCDSSGTKYVLGQTVVDGKQVTAVQSALDTSSTQWVVNLTLNGAATKAFGDLTTTQYNNYYPSVSTNSDDAVLDQTAIVLDGNVQEAPQTQGALTSGQFTISGPQPTGFSQTQATNLAALLKYGQLPVNFKQESVQSISPQLGHSQLVAGLLAGVLGLVLVIIYLFYYYRGLGLVSVSSLLLAALFAYLAVVILSRYQNFTMSLSAIAGLVVAIGITADSFIVYFERLRDEVRDGKTLRPAVEAGWKRARRTILVSDSVSFIAAVVLYHFAVSDVQGFAYTLGLTTVIDVVVVFLFTKPMVTVLAGTKFFSSGHKWSGLDPERLGAKAKWRASTRRTVRTQRTISRQGNGDVLTSGRNSSTSREA